MPCKIIDNRDAPSPRRHDRLLDLQSWDQEQGKRTAEQEGIELTAAHWEVINCLRDYYLEHDPPEHAREIGNMLDRTFAERGGRKYVRRLFPKGPVAQGMRIAGLPLPPYVRDGGFGSSF